MRLVDKTGEINYNRYGTKMKIIKYNNARNITVEFQDEYRYTVDTNYSNFLKGNIKNPYDRYVYNVGYVGEGKYSYKTHTKIHNEWDRMLQRCYDPYFLNEYPTYRDCFVDEYFHCFQNYAKWREDNYYEIPNEVMCLDKDILVKGNKIYSPETCIFVPNRINALFTKSNKARGKYPIGVTYHKRDDILEVNCSIYEGGRKKQKYLGRFSLDKPFQAFTTYKNFKEKYIKRVADEYKDLIPIELYRTMYDYKIEIND